VSCDGPATEYRSPWCDGEAKLNARKIVSAERASYLEVLRGEFLHDSQVVKSLKVELVQILGEPNALQPLGNVGGKVWPTNAETCWPQSF